MERLKNYEDNKEKTGAAHMKEPPYYKLLSSFLHERRTINPEYIGEVGLELVPEACPRRKRPRTDLERVRLDDEPWPSTSGLLGIRHIAPPDHLLVSQGPLDSEFRSLTPSEWRSQTPVLAELQVPTPGQVLGQVSGRDSSDLPDIVEEEDDPSQAGPATIPIQKGQDRRRENRINRPPTRTTIIADFLRELRDASERQEARQQQRFDEIKRHNRATESILQNLVNNQKEMAQRGNDIIARILHRADFS